MLINAVRLREKLSDPTCVIFDCRHDLTDFERGQRVYRVGHIPGAHFVDFETALAGEKTGRNGRHPLPDAVQFAGFLEQHGVTAESQIVAYDDSGGSYAARLWWLTRWIGLDHAAVLNGGYNGWVAGGHSIRPEVPLVRHRGSVVPRPRQALCRSAAEVLSGTTTGDCLVIDARAPERFRGEVEPVDKVAGHIPKAVNRFFKLNLNQDQTMRPASDLRSEFDALLGGRDPVDVVHQCGSGVTACVNLLAMEYAGLVGSTLYAGSWSEWSADPTRPIAVGDPNR